MIVKLPKPHSCSIHPDQVVTYLFDFLIKVELSGLLVFLQLVDDSFSFFSVVSHIQIVILSCAYCPNAVYE